MNAWYLLRNDLRNRPSEQRSLFILNADKAEVDIYIYIYNSHDVSSKNLSKYTRPHFIEQTENLSFLPPENLTILNEAWWTQKTNVKLLTKLVAAKVRSQLIYILIAAARIPTRHYQHLLNHLRRLYVEGKSRRTQ